jgi:hypothetical protein
MEAEAQAVAMEGGADEELGRGVTAADRGHDAGAGERWTLQGHGINAGANQARARRETDFRAFFFRLSSRRP